MRKICCFAGHSDLCGADVIYGKLLSVIKILTETQGILEYWVGNYGAFDSLCAEAVRELKIKYPGVQLNLVVPYLTAGINEYKEQFYANFDNILLADVPENTPKRLKIIKCNQYMIKNADVLVCYVEHSFGGAAKTLEYARKREVLKIINLAE
ncbi:MAG: DUF1273 family protein [Clostridia bacterium]|nr:DUF1273 family protein [Clostridia bacterium]